MRDDQLELVVRGGTVVTAEGRRQADIGVAGGRSCASTIAAMPGIRPRRRGTPRGAREIDASGRLVLPGGVDPHVHLNIEGTDPGEPRWVDDYMTGSRAALAGGVTSVGNMAFVLPWESIADRVRRETALVAEQAIADVFFHTVIVQPSADILAEVGRAVAGGQSSMKMFMTMPTFEANVPAFTRVMKATGDAGGITLVHCEDLPTIECCTTMLAEHARLGLAHFAHSRPVAAETVATERAIAMCRATGAPTYVRAPVVGARAGGVRGGAGRGAADLRRDAAAVPLPDVRALPRRRRRAVRGAAAAARARGSGGAVARAGRRLDRHGRQRPRAVDARAQARSEAGHHARPPRRGRAGHDVAAALHGGRRHRAVDR